MAVSAVLGRFDAWGEGNSTLYSNYDKIWLFNQKQNKRINVKSVNANVKIL